MNGRITIDGFYKGEEGYELHTHGGKPNPEALCSLTLSIHQNIEVRKLLGMMCKSVDRFIEEDNRLHLAESINRALVEEGHEPLKQDVVDCILNEFAFQEASQMTDDESGVNE